MEQPPLSSRIPGLDQPTPPQLPAGVALFLDFDGTLVPIQEDPDACLLKPEQSETLRGLRDTLDESLALISGRDIRDLAARVPRRVWRLGGHGLEVLSPQEEPAKEAPPAPPALVTAIQSMLIGKRGSRLEVKGPVLAVHYRQAPEQGPRLADLMAKIVSEHQGYKLQHGKMVLEAKPEHANKGIALERMLEQDPFKGRTPVMVGDDTTDEDAMDVANAAGGWSVKVGEGPSIAKYRLGSVSEVWSWLRQAQ